MSNLEWGEGGQNQDGLTGLEGRESVGLWGLAGLWKELAGPWWEVFVSAWVVGGCK